MARFVFKTSFQFPFFKMNEIVSYTEVKRPSGFAYMILVLINESKDKHMGFAQVLGNCGVPDALHGIYAREVDFLIREEILTINDTQYRKSRFNKYRIGDFQFTEKGRKVFADERLPSGTPKEAKIPVYFDICKEQLYLTIPKSLELRPLRNSAITEEFMEGFSCSKNIEDFFNANKGKEITIDENGKVVGKVLIRIDEMITKVEEISKENWTGKYDCTLAIEGNYLAVEFDETSVQKFFDENYTAEMINKAISYKSKFTFDKPFDNNAKISDFKDHEIVDILIPQEVQDELKNKVKIFITKGSYRSNDFQIENYRGIDNFCHSCEFIIVDSNNNCFAFIPGNFSLDSKFGTIHVPLVLKLKISSDELQQVLSLYVENLRTYSEKGFDELVRISSISKDYDRAYEILTGYVKRDSESNLVLLNEMKSTAEKDNNILRKYRELVDLNYNSYVEKVTEDSLSTFLKITNGIPKVLNIDSRNVLEKIFTNLGEVRHKQDVYECLVENGFDKKVVVLYVNPVLEALKKRKSNEKTLSDLIHYDDCISTLKTLSGISDYQRYEFDEESINRKGFKTVYVNAHSLEKNIELFEIKNAELFKEYKGFMQLFKAINDDFNMLDDALLNPQKISKDLIDKKITAGDYQFVFVNLSAKLEIILKNKYGLEGKLSDMLSTAKSRGLIDENIVDDLHTFRKNRNAYIHPEERALKFKPEDLTRWCDEIFALEVSENEQTGDR